MKKRKSVVLHKEEVITEIELMLSFVESNKNNENIRKNKNRRRRLQRPALGTRVRRTVKRPIDAAARHDAAAQHGLQIAPRAKEAAARRFLSEGWRQPDKMWRRRHHGRSPEAPKQQRPSAPPGA
ncbi:hypothetical protein GUJ93_ZPchr0013g37006 [Zizania palustris]|uniref:Uncharacterized protein n=1 Tax=Zizania palustris TaxID=103762 RepID=A0A8J5WXG5_ZIZPA|nr:hypothetical protein GUJ93_ZPchr0013g37716 [Zizania palustris]KAG8097776.1 hypothetical protein GUJ93_ZPchr0013g34114 [Zizania palustris]KAG8097777.1 hypothetical protein GUJ93_ZPchr0013g35478 [Zizania palustris]KAG8097778.1 hypothetical protein GUJ93_ZPchr0013g37006 [Zizania palustris]